MSSQERPVKQVIVIRRDLKMRRGKEIAQGAHAAMAWLTRRMSRLYYDYPAVTDQYRYWPNIALSAAEHAWVSGSFRKITCQVPSMEELAAVHEAAEAAGLEVHLITDSGLTEFHGEPTPTALAIGPDYDDRIDPVTRGLELY